MEDLEIRIKTAIDAAGSAQTLGELKKSIKDLKGLALQTEQGSAAFNKLTAAIGKSNDKLGDLNAAIKTQTGNNLQNLIGAFGGISKVALNSFQVAQGAASAFGDETGVAMEQMKKLQGIMAMTQGLSALADVGDTINNVSAALKSNLVPAYQAANSAIINLGTSLKSISFASITEGMSSFFSSVASGFSTLLSKAGTFFNGVKAFAASNPLGLILIAITAIIGALGALSDSFNPITDLFDGIKAVINGVIQAVKDFTDAIGISQFKQDANTKKTLENTEKQKKAIQDRYDAEIKLAQAAGRETASLERQKALNMRAQDLEEVAALEEKERRKGKLDEKDRERLAKAREDAAKQAVEIKVIETKSAKTLSDIFIENQKTKIAAMKEGGEKTKAQLQLDLQEQTRLYEQQRDKIFDLYDAISPAPSSIILESLKANEEAFNETTKKIKREANEAALKNYEDYKQKRIKQINEEYDLIISKDESILKKVQLSNENKAKYAEIELERALRAADKEGKDKLQIREDYSNEISNLAQQEIEQEESIYKSKRKAQEKIMSINKETSLEYKKAQIEIGNLDAEMLKKRTDINTKYLDIQEQALAKSLSNYMKENESSLAKTYQLELAAAEESAKIARDRADKLIMSEEAKAAEMKNINDRLEAEKLVISSKYIKEAEKLYEEATDIEVSEKTKALAELDALTHRREQAAQAAYDLEVAMAQGNAEKIKQLKEALAAQMTLIHDEQARKQKEIDDKYATGVSASFAKIRDNMKTTSKDALDYIKGTIEAASALYSSLRELSALRRDEELKNVQQEYATKEAKIKYQTDLQTQQMNDAWTIAQAARQEELNNFTGTEEEKQALIARNIEIEKANARERVNRENRLAQEAYDRALAQYNLEEGMRKKSFEENKKTQIAMAVMSGALAVVNALATQPFIPLGLASAVIAAITAAVNIMKIQATTYRSSGQPPQPPIPKDPNAAAASIIGPSKSGGTSGGGGSGPTAPAFFGLGQAKPNTMIKQEGPVKVYVLEEDITSTQRRVEVVQSRATTKI